MNMISRIFLPLWGLLPGLALGNPQILEIEAVIQLLLNQGYHDIREIELEGGRYQVQALNAHDRKVTLYLDADSGEHLKEVSANAASSAAAAPSAPPVTPAPAADR
ncbi:PepSY domain-containing protein [Aeromonas simiae]|uniref:PepSY domain-containing protein n=1 Tax=Aeromonas simiae TaxID=218936 RepID=A0A5J6WS11_9GAMM|nr:PepSY domain-containing protein [Aeromonas simiae]QFI53620.1 PepSY domain-containing protein [Aeromonas simiae]